MDQNTGERDQTKRESDHNVSIALIQKDIQYMRESMTKVESSFMLLDKNFARKDDFIGFEKGMAKIIEEHKKEIASKADASDLQKISSTLSRINWMLITAVIVGLLSLVIKGS